MVLQAIQITFPGNFFLQTVPRVPSVHKPLTAMSKAPTFPVQML